MNKGPRRLRKIPTEAADIIALLTSLGVTFSRIGIEAGPLSQWLVNALTAVDLPVVMHRADVGSCHESRLLTASTVTGLWPFDRGRDFEPQVGRGTHGNGQVCVAAAPPSPQEQTRRDAPSRGCAGRTSYVYAGGGTKPPISAASSRANSIVVKSSPSGPMICRPAGSPSRVKPIGAAVAGR
jgi:hypothetical protein